MAFLRLLSKGQTMRVLPMVSHGGPVSMASFSDQPSDDKSTPSFRSSTQQSNQSYDSKFHNASQPSLPGIDAMDFIQGFQSREHEFTQFRTRNMDRAGEESEVCANGNFLDSEAPEDPYNNCYQPMSNVSLHSVMQTNVPEPYNSTPGHMNMPGGGIKMQDKFTSGQMHDTHYLNNKKGGGSTRSFSTSTMFRNNDRSGDQGVQGPFPWLNGETIDSLSKKEDPAPQGIQGMNCNHFKLWLENCTKYNMIECEQQLTDLKEGRKTLAQIFKEQELLIEKVADEYKSQASYGKVSNEQPSTPVHVSVSSKISQKERLKQAISQYGSTVVVFHIGISLISLGGFYVAVSSGLDVIGILGKLGVGQSILESRVAAGASTFVVAYAVHKVFAPVRIAITLTCTPLIVRYLRGIGILKQSKTLTKGK